jgi:hypothetical protein
MGKVSEKNCWENQNTNLSSITFSPENHAVYQIMWIKLIEPDKP